MSNYENKSIDIAAFLAETDCFTHELSQELLREGGAVCTGIQKLIQRWLLLLLTPMGSVRFQPERGCNFLTRLQSARSPEEINTSCVLSNSVITDQLLKEEDDAMPDDERLQSVTFNSIQLYGDTINLGVTITSRAGTSRTIQLPLYQNPIVF